MATLQKNGPDLFHHGGAFADELVAHPVRNLCRARPRLQRDELHGRTGCGFCDCRGVAVVILLRLDRGLHIFWRHQPDAVALNGQDTANVMHATAAQLSRALPCQDCPPPPEGLVSCCDMVRHSRPQICIGRGTGRCPCVLGLIGSGPSPCRRWLFRAHERAKANKKATERSSSRERTHEFMSTLSGRMKNS